jgi:alpha-ketoglutarate-dependent 2,4-dichlorophenoxyacetate dioxygenase
LSYDELFDVNNLIDDGSLLDLNSTCAHFKKGNGLFHVDSSFNPRRAGFNLLRAVELPPPELGGETEFADSRPAFEGLPSLLKEQLLEKDYVVAHSLWQSRKLASPKFFNHTDPNDFPMTRHRLAQLHELSGRVNLYGGAHAHHIEGLDPGEWHALLDKLYAHATQPKYTIKVPWRNQGDVVLWDNTSVMHRAAGGAFEGRFRRDMCRATIHDGSSTAWGLNPVESKVRLGLP